MKCSAFILVGIMSIYQHIAQADNLYKDQASQECMDMVEKNYNIIKKNTEELALKEGGTDAKQTVEQVQLEFSYMKEYLAVAEYNLKYIRVSDMICKYSESTMQGVIAHEFGHVISMLVSKELKEDRKKEIKKYHESYWEMEANYWGAKIFKEAKIDSNMYLQEKDEECKKIKNNYVCDAPKYWRQGLTGKKLKM